MPESLRARISSATWVRILSSLILALLMWGWVTASEDPERTRLFRDVRVEIGELPGSLIVVGEVPAVDVRLTGPRSVIDSVELTELRAALDLDGVNQPGNYSVRVNVTTPDGIWDRDVTPVRVPIIVNTVTSERFELDPVEVGEVDAQRRRITITPAVSEVTVSGASSIVARVDRVVLPIDVGTRLQDFEGTFEPRALAADGQAITEVTIAPEAIAASVMISSRGKSVAVLTQLIGSPEIGYEVLDRTVNPATVVVDGPQEVLDTLFAVETDPIDLTGATASISRRVGVRGLPEGVRVIDPPSGLVEVFIQIGRRGVRQPLPGLTVAVTNLGPGLAADVNPREVTVVVVASEDILGNLTADDIMVQIDVGGRGPGTYDIRPNVAVPPNVQWIQTEPEVVSVSIADGPTAAPSPRATSLEGSPAPTPE